MAVRQKNSSKQAEESVVKWGDGSKDSDTQASIVPEQNWCFISLKGKLQPPAVQSSRKQEQKVHLASAKENKECSSVQNRSFAQGISVQAVCAQLLLHTDSQVFIAHTS